ncbi:hypothetical protein [Mycobacterium marinum]|uniref:hypothetical protein n=1 Tax=Mycobacterium marinum TaxID=1781 RepID=UPI00235A2680|nr:hypothetical protein [Mycobacterium marinum]MDC9015202.1 hypothetical protein [Mycobacterium marinum]
MAGYGYRLWAVDLHHGRKHQRHQFGAAQLPFTTDDTGEAASDAVREVDFIAAAQRDVTSAVRRTHNFGLSKGDDDEGAAAAKGASIRFVSAEREQDGGLRLKFEYGVRHADGTLIDPDDPEAPDISLKDKSTLHPYRATLVSRPELTRGLLAVEARGRSCPMASVVRGLNRVSVDNWRLRPISHLAGEAAMIAYISQSQIKRVNFDQWSYEADGARNRREFMMAVLTQFEGEAIKDRVIQWARDFFRFQKEHVTEKEVELANLPDMAELTAEERQEVRRQARERLRADKARARVERRLAGRKIAHDEAGALKQTVFANRQEDVEIEFTDVSVELDNGGASKTYNPLSDFGRFTYGISDRYPRDPVFYTQAEATALNLLDLVQGLQLTT